MESTGGGWAEEKLRRPTFRLLRLPEYRSAESLNVGQTKTMMNQNETLQREAINRDPEFGLKMLRIRHGMMTGFLVFGVALLVTLCVLVVTGYGPAAPSSQTYAGVFLVLWNAVVLAMLRHSSTAMDNIRRDIEAMNQLR